MAFNLFNEVLDKYGNQKTKVLSSTRSDHHPILVTTNKLQTNESRKPKVFKLKAKWIKHEKENHVIKAVLSRKNFALTN